MAASVAAGSRLVVHAPGGRTAVVRSLRDVSMIDGWCIPVLADAAALMAPTMAVDLPTDQGMVRVEAELVWLDGVLALHAPGTDAVLVQRRSDVRGAVQLPLRGTLLSLGPAATAVAAELPAALRGTTLSVSAGGLAFRVGTPIGEVPAGARLYLELQLPVGELAPAVLTVVDHTLVERIGSDARGYLLRGRFLDISARDRERLVQLVFECQRQELAARRRDQG